ncbi:hypothetical protein A6302_00498 [Methylobrevis pamukkalensis]|uniref:Uncharacterized protein n=1 Tax=Methylobrevis pamukkalensis TaxID=1439726 RepID=A0A1E3H7A4_9HYPH|nr:hypothetical protein A6302_00498 [Methylobrevis pamukkalensis]
MTLALALIPLALLLLRDAFRRFAADKDRELSEG